ncbi:MAG: MarC family protein [Rhizomicrobium sp.]
MSLSLSLWSAFVTLFVTIGPIETATVFASLTTGVHRSRRTSLAARSVSIAGVMLLLFALGGNLLLGLLHVTLPAFQIAGGILLFLHALTLTFASPGLSSISEGEHREAERPGDIAVLPLAFPMIAGPGSLSAVVLLMSRLERWSDELAVLVLLAACLALTFVAMLLADVLQRWLGQTGSDVVGRISGVLLAALAVQFVLDGLRQSGLVH